jgi:hypothetical protein
MTIAGQAFPYVVRERGLGVAGLAPMLPLTLAATRSVAVSGLLDTGATASVLPYARGGRGKYPTGLGGAAWRSDPTTRSCGARRRP